MSIHRSHVYEEEMPVCSTASSVHSSVPIEGRRISLEEAFQNAERYIENLKYNLQVRETRMKNLEELVKKKDYELQYYIQALNNKEKERLRCEQSKQGRGLLRNILGTPMRAS